MEEALVSRFLVLLIACVPLASCWRYDPLYCDSQEDCADNPGLTFCDLNGEYEASEHIARTCIPPQPVVREGILELTGPSTASVVRVGQTTTVQMTIARDAAVLGDVTVEVSPTSGLTASPITLGPAASGAELVIRAAEDATQVTAGA
jgi:hypothetical protein